MSLEARYDGVRLTRWRRRYWDFISSFQLESDVPVINQKRMYYLIAVQVVVVKYWDFISSFQLESDVPVILK